MPFSFQHKGSTVRVSLKDIFKSSKELKEDLDAIARKRAAIADKNALIEAIMKQQEREAEEAKKTETERKPAEENGNANPNPNPSGNANGGGEGSAPDQVVRFGPPQTWVAPGQQNGNGDGNKDQAKGNVGGSAPNAGMAWTEEQDAELRRMKGENGQWKAIATELGRHVHEVKSRWGQIKPPEEGKKEKKGKQRERQKDEEKAERTEESPTVATEPKKEKKNKQPDPDPDFTVGELILLNQLAAKYEDDKWLRISSRFFDKTGKRLSPQEAKARVESWS